LDSCTLLACQINIPIVRNVPERTLHVENMIGKITDQLDQRPADLVVLPELSSIEYSREAFEQLSVLAEDFEGPSVNAVRALAIKYQTAIVFGMPRRMEDHYRISQIAIAADGDILGCYDKLHICQYGASMEKDYFERGSDVAVFDIAGFRFAPIICYDIRIPELCRSLTLQHEVDCILHSGAYFRDESFASWHAFATTRAMENQLYLLSLNRAGEDYGDSIFCPPWIDEDHPASHFSAHQEDFRYFTLDRQTISKTREQYTFLKDRLTDY
jgi:predicted amidohydrolase